MITTMLPIHETLAALRVAFQANNDIPDDQAVSAGLSIAAWMIEDRANRRITYSADAIEFVADEGAIARFEPPHADRIADVMRGSLLLDRMPYPNDLQWVPTHRGIIAYRTSRLAAHREAGHDDLPVYAMDEPLEQRYLLPTDDFLLLKAAVQYSAPILARRTRAYVGATHHVCKRATVERLLSWGLIKPADNDASPRARASVHFTATEMGRFAALHDGLLEQRHQPQYYYDQPLLQRDARSIYA